MPYARQNSKGNIATKKAPPATTAKEFLTSGPCQMTGCSRKASPDMTIASLPGTDTEMVPITNRPDHLPIERNMIYINMLNLQMRRNLIARQSIR